MYVSRLKLTDFRNFRQITLAFNRECVFLKGENAQGKTNLLEAVFLCAAGRSHRTSFAKDMVRHECDKAGVKLMVNRAEGPQTIDIRLYTGAKQDVYINGIKAKRLGELMGHINCVMFAPEDLNLVKEGPALRRRFLDMELSQLRPSYFYAIQRYQRALKQRNALLRDIARQPSLKRTLPVWDEQMAQAGFSVLKERRAFCDKLAVLALDLHRQISGGAEALGVRYEPGIGRDTDSAEGYYEALQASRAQDLARGMSLVGVHRDDIALDIGGRDIRGYGSQGQQRTAAIALKLSELSFMREQTGQWPVLLLDDVFSELDTRRQETLLAHIKDVQAFITGTTATALPPRFARELTVKGGAVVGY